MKKTKIIFYIFTALLSISMLMGAYFELTGYEASQQLLIHLGYPLYFNYILGIAKILGIIALWQTFSPTIKEWAYAGFVFDLIGAVVSHAAVGDPVSQYMPAVINLLFVVISYMAYRKLTAPENQVVTVRV